MSKSRFALSEVQLEDYFCHAVEERQNWRVIKRQVRLDCGIADVLVRDDERTGPWGVLYRVVELKVEPLKARDLTQVLSYVCELKSKHPDKNISGVLIGPTLADRHLVGCLRHLGGDYASPAVAMYGLYNFDPLSGIQFDWASELQKQKETLRDHWYADRVGRLARSGRSGSLDLTCTAINPFGEEIYVK